MLFETARHEPLQGADWSPSRASVAIRTIVTDLESALSDGIVWPEHPLDVSAEPGPPPKTLYLGSSGALWAMSYLQAEGAVSLHVRPADLIGRIYESYLGEPDTGTVVPSYFLGAVGILLVLWRLTGSRDAADRLESFIAENISNAANEALWGAPGTMLGALHMYEWTGESRWRELFVRNADQLWGLWLPSEHADCNLWTQDLYGRIVQLIGAGHGFAGNAYPLLRGAALLPEERRKSLYEGCLKTMRATAVFEGDGVNWPQSVGPARPGRTHMVMQWCHGAPGMITGLADFPLHWSADMDELLIRAGRSVWSAGPLSKGHGLCHGTAGNGYAFLKLYQRTGATIWLERARAFAMHAITQQERMHQQYGRGRYSLWTGDPGLAVFLWHCISGSGGMPGLDHFN